jgi:hypothetical protein
MISIIPLAYDEMGLIAFTKTRAQNAWRWKRQFEASLLISDYSVNLHATSAYPASAGKCVSCKAGPK